MQPTGGITGESTEEETMQQFEELKKIETQAAEIRKEIKNEIYRKINIVLSECMRSVGANSTDIHELSCKMAENAAQKILDVADGFEISV